MERQFTIGQLAKAAGVGVETVRYYQRRGLIPLPPRPGGAYRRYSLQDLHRIRFIKRAQALGFSLAEIAELLSLQNDPGQTCAAVRQRAQAKIREIDRKIRHLFEIRTALADLAGQCPGRGPLQSCPILEALEDQSQKEENHD
jgi:Hg(II)-responsive transcriptional regulator